MFINTSPGKSLFAESTVYTNKFRGIIPFLIRKQFSDHVPVDYLFGNVGTWGLAWNLIKGWGSVFIMYGFRAVNIMIYLDRMRAIGQ
jgi:hypothetical protein